MFKLQKCPSCHSVISVGRGGGRVVMVLAWFGVRFPVSPLELQRLGISSRNMTETFLKRRKTSKQPNTTVMSVSVAVMRFLRLSHNLLFDGY